jgi:hypothetical protein
MDEPAVATGDSVHAVPTGIGHGNLDTGLRLINIAAVAAVLINVSVDDDGQCGVSWLGTRGNWQ